jgi:hypothetical protein
MADKPNPYEDGVKAREQARWHERLFRLLDNVGNEGIRLDREAIRALRRIDVITGGLSVMELLWVLDALQKGDEARLAINDSTSADPPSRRN